LLGRPHDADQEGAKAFYGSLLNWDAEDIPVADGVVYSMMRHDGKQVAAISPQRSNNATRERHRFGIPTSPSPTPTRLSNAPKELAERACAGLRRNGRGTNAVLQDPQGAYFMVWQPGRNPGAELVSDVGALVWNELETSDIDGAASFYGELFGWTFAPFEASPTPYTIVMNAGRSNGGITGLHGPGPPHWIPYFGVAEIAGGICRGG